MWFLLTVGISCLLTWRLKIFHATPFLVCIKISQSAFLYCHWRIHHIYAKYEPHAYYTALDRKYATKQMFLAGALVFTIKISLRATQSKHTIIWSYFTFILLHTSQSKNVHRSAVTATQAGLQRRSFLLPFFFFLSPSSGHFSIRRYINFQQCFYLVNSAKTWFWGFWSN